jgi:hypothetical protein
MLHVALISMSALIGRIMLSVLLLAVAVTMGVVLLAVWEGARNFVGLAIYLVRRPLAFRVMQAERDQARAAFEAATKISALRAECARRMAEATRGRR